MKRLREWLAQRQQSAQKKKIDQAWEKRLLQTAHHSVLSRLEPESEAYRLRRHLLQLEPKIPADLAQRLSPKGIRKIAEGGKLVRRHLQDLARRKALEYEPIFSRDSRAEEIGPLELPYLDTRLYTTRKKISGLADLENHPALPHAVRAQIAQVALEHAHRVLQMDIVPQTAVRRLNDLLIELHQITGPDYPEQIIQRIEAVSPYADWNRYDAWRQRERK